MSDGWRFVFRKSPSCYLHSPSSLPLPMYSGLSRATFPSFPFAILLRSFDRCRVQGMIKNKEIEKEKEKER